jgi:maltoporin
MLQPVSGSRTGRWGWPAGCVLSRNDVDVYSRDFTQTTQMNTNSVDLRYRNIPLWQSGRCR